MSLTKCQECNNTVSSHAESCPKCAYPIVDKRSTKAHGGTGEQPKRREIVNIFLSLVFTAVTFLIILALIYLDEYYDMIDFFINLILNFKE